MARVTDALQVLYKFNEGSGLVVYDVSNSGEAVNLYIEDEDTVNWLPGGGISLDSARLSTSGAAEKIISAAILANALTLEVWIKPANVTQAGPARIFGVSNSSLLRNATIAQDGSKINCRMRTTSTDNNGIPALETAADTLAAALTHIVYVRNSGGTTTIYKNAVSVASGTAAGTMSNWDTSYPMLVGNENTDDRPWDGEIYLAAIYARALTVEEITANYLAGHLPEVTGSALYAALTDGNSTVYLRRCNNDSLIGVQDAYAQKVAPMLANGNFDDVTETWSLRMTERSDVDRAITLQALGRLRYRLHMIVKNDARDEWVWLETNTPTEPRRRYAIVRGIDIPQLSPQQYRENARPELILQIRREGAWRSAAPNGDWETKRDRLDSGNVDNQAVGNPIISGSKSNRLKIFPAGGDAPALTRIKIIPDNNSTVKNSTYYLGIRVARTSSALDGFRAHLNAADVSFLVGTGSLVNDEFAPAGKRFERTISGALLDYIQWDFSANTEFLRDYRGRYLAYAVCMPDENGEIQLLLGNVPLTDFVSLDRDVPTGKYALVPLGQIELPPGGLIQEDYLSYNQVVNLYYKFGAAGTFKFRNIWLVPISEAVAGAKLCTNSVPYTLVMDGDARRTYESAVISTVNYRYYESTATLIGDYITLPPNLYAAFYYFGARKHADHAHEWVEVISHTAQLQIEHYSRYQTLRP